MSYQLELSEQANNNIATHKKSGNKVLMKKLYTLLDELTDHPRTGTVQVEI